MTQGIRVTLGVLALCLIVLLLVVSKQMANSRTLRQEVDTVRHTLTTSQQQQAAQALVQRLQQQVEHTRAQIAHTEAQRQQAQDQVVHTEAQLQQVQDWVTTLQQEHAQLLQSNQTLQQRVQQQMQEHAAVQTQRDQWQATAREHEEQAQAVHEELRTTRLALNKPCVPLGPRNSSAYGNW